MEQIVETSSFEFSQRRFATSVARDEHEVREAQRLRYRVFVQELGASIPEHVDGLDCDEFDPYCDHLLVRDNFSDSVVGTYRMLSAANAKRVGGFYSAHEFDLDNLAPLYSETVEVGRACVDPEFRSGAVIATLWAGLANYILERGYGYAIGCGSLPLADGGRFASSVYQALRRECLGPEDWRVFPRCPFPVQTADLDPAPRIPPLVKGYLRLGAFVCGGPAWDQAFKTADVLLLLPIARMNHRYLARFLRSGGLASALTSTQEQAGNQDRHSRHGCN